MPTTETSASRVLSATDPRELFGDNPKRARIRYQRLAKELHPDVGGSEEAMSRLNALWAEYTSGGGSKRPSEITRSFEYAVLDDGDNWLVVDRKVGHRATISDTGDLAGIIDGTPVCMVDATSAFLIKQPNGPHPAYRVTPPDTIKDGVVSINELASKLPSGRLHPADLAWVFKRVLFLAAAIGNAGLTFTREPSECIAIGPDTHMLAVIAPWNLRDGTRSIANQRAVVASFEKATSRMVADDAKSQRIARFIRGTVLDGVTESGVLLREYDDALYGLFGRPRFHVMERCL